MAVEQEIWAIGRRKTSVARVRLREGEGKIIVNNKPADSYFTRKTHLIAMESPFKLTNTINRYDVIARVNGGGNTGQAEALRMGISRALVKVNAEFRSILKKNGLLTRDSRMKERKKYGQAGARKRFQYSKR